MPISANAVVELTRAADPLIRRSRGRLASDEAQAAGRIAHYLTDTDQAPIGELMRECQVTPTVLAALIHCGALVLPERAFAADRCERCGAHAPESALCGACRSQLSRGGRPSSVIEPELPTRLPSPGSGSRSTRSLGMRSTRQGERRITPG